MNMTESWQQQTLTIEHDPNWNRQTLTNVWGPPNLHAWCFFLVEEQSDGAIEAGQVFQPVWAWELGLGDLSKLTAPAYFWGVKLMFVGVVNFGHVPTLRFISVRIFWSKFNQNLVILIRSCEHVSCEHVWYSNRRKHLQQKGWNVSQAFHSQELSIIENVHEDL